MYSEQGEDLEEKVLSETRVELESAIFSRAGILMQDF